LEYYAGLTPEALDALSAEERRRVYKMLRLKVVTNFDEGLEVIGALVEHIDSLDSEATRRNCIIATSG
jgi:hypothetical protein